MHGVAACQHAHIVSVKCKCTRDKDKQVLKSDGRIFF
ncbi:unnamed protein product [Amoebophrya sp. A120]|nr:unnamed protein product [Amoebophrya sp. A120]|eukprot:GSA120T00009543001.1